MIRPKRRNRHQSRRAAAVAELAICLPAIMLLVLGALECCTMIFLRQSLHVSAYEGVRVAIRNDSETADVIARCNRVLTEREVQGPLIVITPATTETVPRGDDIQVRVSAPCGPNSVLPLQFFGGDLSSTATMNKE